MMVSLKRRFTLILAGGYSRAAGAREVLRKESSVIVNDCVEGRAKIALVIQTFLLEKAVLLRLGLCCLEESCKEERVIDTAKKHVEEGEKGPVTMKTGIYRYPHKSRSLL